MLDPVTVEATKEARQLICTLLGNVLGPPSQKLGALFADRVQEWRQRRMEKSIERAVEIVREANARIEAVRPRLLFAILDGSSKEDDEVMAERWARLLASAATGSSMHPAYPRILEDLTPFEAQLLDEFDPNMGLLRPEQIGPPDDQHRVAGGNLLRLQLIPHLGWYSLNGKAYLPGLSDLGWDFVAKCRGPGWTWEMYQSPQYS